MSVHILLEFLSYLLIVIGIDILKIEEFNTLKYFFGKTVVCVGLAALIGLN